MIILWQVGIGANADFLPKSPFIKPTYGGVGFSYNFGKWAIEMIGTRIFIYVMYMYIDIKCQSFQFCEIYVSMQFWEHPMWYWKCTSFYNIWYARVILIFPTVFPSCWQICLKFSQLCWNVSSWPWFRKKKVSKKLSNLAKSFHPHLRHPLLNSMLNHEWLSLL